MVAVEAKYVRSPGGSALHEGTAPSFIQDRWATEFDNEMTRYGQIIRGSGTPVGRLRIVAHTQAAADYLGGRARTILGPDVDLQIVVPK